MAGFSACVAWGSSSARADQRHADWIAGEGCFVFGRENLTPGRRQLAGKLSAAAEEQKPMRIGLARLAGQGVEVLWSEAWSSHVKNRGFALHSSMAPGDYHDRIGLDGESFAESKKLLAAGPEDLRRDILRHAE